MPEQTIEEYHQELSRYHHEQAMKIVQLLSEPDCPQFIKDIYSYVLDNLKLRE